MQKAGQTSTLGFAGAQVLGMTSSSIGGMNKGYGGTTSARVGESSFLGASKLNYRDDMMNQDEHSLKVRRLLEKVRKMINNGNT